MAAKVLHEDLLTRAKKFMRVGSAITRLALMHRRTIRKAAGAERWRCRSTERYWKRWSCGTWECLVLALSRSFIVRGFREFGDLTTITVSHRVLFQIT